MRPSFDRFDLSQTMLNTLARIGYQEPMPIQEAAIPLIMDGRDVIGQARTGTGKTAAFGIPLVERTSGRDLQSLIIAPTRELANQLVEELNKLGKGTPFRAGAVYGGVGHGKQRAMFRRGSGYTCIVACPGRLLDHIENGVVDLRGIHTVVLDEADRMLDMGFIRDIERIFRELPRQRQTLLFSATIPDEILRLAARFQDRPENVRAETGSLATPLAEQFVVDIEGEATAELLTLLDRERPQRAVIFVHTKHTARRLGAKLKAAGHRAEALQGNMSQAARDRAMDAFRRGRVNVLVATDVAARGIDVAELTHVIQFDMPTTPEDHLHRTGRTGRAGKQGRAFLFAPPQADRALRKIERTAGIRLEPFPLGELVSVPDHVHRAGPAPRRYESIAAGGTVGMSSPRGGRRPPQRRARSRPGDTRGRHGRRRW